MYSERPKMDLEELPPFRQRPPQFASKQSREGGNHHAGRVTRALRRKIPEKAVKNTDFHSTPGSDLRREADCRVLPFLNNAMLGQASHRIRERGIARGHRKIFRKSSSKKLFFSNITFKFYDFYFFWPRT